MAKKKNPTTKSVEALKHDEAKRKNIPTAEYQSVLQKEEQNPVRVAYERRNRDLDPQLVWRGKDEQDWSDLVVHAPPLYIQEKVHPKALIDDLLRETRERQYEAGELTPDLFADFNGIPKGVDKTEFYQHDQNWSNRMILGDSLQVMASLAEREGLRGKVQCIYLDPPYGIKFNSNFQWSTTSREVKDGNVAHITREPEQVKAFRDTWRDGIHSYLTYLRDRLTVARDLLTESGSIFVQIGDENVHLVRSLLEEVFGKANFISQVTIAKTAGATSELLPGISDYIIWFAKNLESLKYRQLFQEKLGPESGAGEYKYVVEADGQTRSMAHDEKDGKPLPPQADLYRPSATTSQRPPGSDPFTFQGLVFTPGSAQYWKTSIAGLTRLGLAGRLIPRKASISYMRRLRDFPVMPINNLWLDTRWGFDAQDKRYVVETNTKVVARCLLMATDPGDIVLDPTCGSGTTAYCRRTMGPPLDHD
ncbi:MAG: site-specific DNA-methyltransferase [Candidatus Manganitrophus sp.]|nr:MAG: site-specific DNA-methyltransferase [Candidatus Manganitrophus sp.]